MKNTYTVRGVPIALFLQGRDEMGRAESYETKEPETLDWIDQTLRTGDVFFDIGANIGLYSLYAAVRFKGDVSCFAFEPEPSNFKRLHDNIIINKLSGSLLAYALAIASRPCLDRFYLNPETFAISEQSGAEAGSAMHSLGSPHAFSGELFADGHVCGVACASVDSLWREYGLPVPTHVKIDVDGLGASVVDGMRQTLKRPELRHILLEVNPKTDQELIKILRSEGFTPDSRFIGKSVNTMYNIIFSRQTVKPAASNYHEENSSQRLIAPLTICGAPTAGKNVLFSLIEGHKNIFSIPVWHDFVSSTLCMYPQLYDQYFSHKESAIEMTGNDRRLEVFRALLTNHTEWNSLEGIAHQGFYVYHLTGSERLRLPVSLDFYELEKQINTAVWQDNSRSLPVLFHAIFSALHKQLGHAPLSEVKYAVSTARNEFSDYHRLLTAYPEGKVLYVDRDIAEALAVTVHRKAKLEGKTFLSELDAFFAGNNEFLSLLTHRTEYVEHLASLYPDRVLRVYFSDIIMNTEVTMRRVCEWLGVDFHPVLLKGTFMGRVIDDRITGAILDNMREILSPNEWDRLEEYIAHFRRIYAHANKETAEEINLLAFLFSTRHTLNESRDIVVTLNTIDDNIFYGPYMVIPQGMWKAVFCFSGTATSYPPDILWRIDCVDHTDRKYFEKTYSLQDILRSPSITFSVEKRNCKFEFRAYGSKSDHDLEIIFHGVKLQRTATLNAAENKGIAQRLLSLFQNKKTR